MQNVRDLLNRFLHLVPKDRKPKEATLAVLQERFPGVADGVSLEFQNSIMFIRAGSALKHAVQLKKTEILEEIGRRIGAGVVKDIR